MSETTEIIHRRIRHWKTTAAGVAAIVAPIAASIWPEHAIKILSAASALSGAGLLAAADAKKEK